MGAAVKSRTCIDIHFELLQRRLAVYHSFEEISKQDAKELLSNVKQAKPKLTPELRLEIKAVLAKVH